jgi:hypothetical protein
MTNTCDFKRRYNTFTIIHSCIILNHPTSGIPWLSMVQPCLYTPYWMAIPPELSSVPKAQGCHGAYPRDRWRTWMKIIRFLGSVSSPRWPEFTKTSGWFSCRTMSHLLVSNGFKALHIGIESSIECFFNLPKHFSRFKHGWVPLVEGGSQKWLLIIMPEKVECSFPV